MLHKLVKIISQLLLVFIIEYGGNEFKSGTPLRPRLYTNNKGTFVRDVDQFKEIEINGSKVKFIDFDNDNDLDLCITSDVEKTVFGKSAQQYLFENDGTGNFRDVTKTIAPGFQRIGNVKDVVFEDLNGDRKKDLIVIGHWMPVTIFLNVNNQFIKSYFGGLEKSNGWWNTIKANDFDRDGDVDLIVGNWGLNSRLQASEDLPVTLYSYDFDDNGYKDPVISYYYKGEETLFSSKEELAKQLPSINKKYLTHESFANASFKDILTTSKLRKSEKKRVYELATCYFENLGQQKFKKQPFPYFGQISAINDIFVYDFNKDAYPDIMLAGNNYELNTQLSKLDASHGEVLINDQKGGFSYVPYYHFGIQGTVQAHRKIKIKDKTYLLVARNNDSILSYIIE